MGMEPQKPQQPQGKGQAQGKGNSQPQGKGGASSGGSGGGQPQGGAPQVFQLLGQMLSGGGGMPVPAGGPMPAAGGAATPGPGGTPGFPVYQGPNEDQSFIPQAQGFQGASAGQQNPNEGGASSSPSSMTDPSTTQGGMGA